MSRELGTKLTGRHITKELFPFTFREFSLFNNIEASPDSLLQYLHTGGFPEYVKQHASEILNYIFEDILIRDIAVRYGIRDVKTLQRLALYLVSNVGKLVTANRFKSLFEVGSTNTITEYLSHFEDSCCFNTYRNPITRCANNWSTPKKSMPSIPEWSVLIQGHLPKTVAGCWKTSFICT